MAAVEWSQFWHFALQFFVVCLIIWVTWTLWSDLRPSEQHPSRSVAILVLGDIGRSPRMMYHAQSFADNEFATDIIAFGGSKPIPSLERRAVQFRYLPEPPGIIKYLPFILAAPIKISLQIISILYVLLVQITVPPEFILVQNPPSIPTLALVQLTSYLRGSKIIIDWHNFGYSILALKLGKRHPFVRIAAWFEKTFGRSAYAHLFVTRAMCDHLSQEWDLRGQKVILYDRPPKHFHRSSPHEVHDLFRRIQPVIMSQKSLLDFLPQTSPPYSTIFTHSSSRHLKEAIRNGSHSRRAEIRSRISTPSQEIEPTYPEVRLPSLRPDRPGLVVSSTSWTPDEDFEILLKAAEMYEIRAGELSSKSDNGEGLLPKLLIILTGKGPMKNQFMERIGKLQESWKWVRCASLWLEAEDYPILLGSADLGISLHSSSSGVDLPMKVVDMFGCGLPVCALNFKCLNELVKYGKNGLVFEDAAQLAEQLEDLFVSFPDSPRLRSLMASLTKAIKRPITPLHTHTLNRVADSQDESEWKWGTWEENWGRIVKPLILKDANL